MRASDDAGFGYRIRRTASGWSWVAFAADGGVLAQGGAPNRATAAACVVRAIARAHAPAIPADQGATASNRPAW
jgi:hypothetical protein